MHNKYDSLIRNDTCKHIREVRRILRGISILENEPEPPKNRFWIFALFIWVIGGLFVLLFMTGCAQAYSDQEAIQTIVGEASNQGYEGMVCVGEVIRHNHSLKDFYGLHASHSLKEGEKTWAMAKRAWIRSKNTNYTKGANHFENINAFGQPFWVKACIKTFTWKDHVFYRERKA